jgi:hypothetical protein
VSFITIKLAIPRTPNIEHPTPNNEVTHNFEIRYSVFDIRYSIWSDTRAPRNHLFTTCPFHNHNPLNIITGKNTHFTARAP